MNYDIRSEVIDNVILSILAIFLPPLSIYIKYGVTDNFYINFPLTYMGLFPGSLHALWCIWSG